MADLTEEQNDIGLSPAGGSTEGNASQESDLVIAAFQINDSCLFTIRQDGDVCSSGLARSIRGNGQHVLFFDGQMIICSIEETATNSAVVGAYEGQIRYSWRGKVLDVIDAPETPTNQTERAEGDRQ